MITKEQLTKKNILIEEYIKSLSEDNLPIVKEGCLLSGEVYIKNNKNIYNMKTNECFELSENEYNQLLAQTYIILSKSKEYMNDLLKFKKEKLN